MRIETSEAINNGPSYPASHSFDHFRHERHYSANDGGISGRPSEKVIGLGRTGQTGIRLISG